MAVDQTVSGSRLIPNKSAIVLISRVPRLKSLQTRFRFAMYLMKEFSLFTRGKFE
jgi:hypothetical protein